MLKIMDNNITHNDSSLWCVIRTKPGDEHRVEANLEKQGIEVFLPLVETYRNNHGKMVRVTKPLFLCYIFARLNLNIHYEKVRFTRGVDKILKLSNHTFPISDKVIETLKARTGKGFLNHKEEWRKDDTAGTVSSPFDGLRKIFLQQKLT